MYSEQDRIAVSRRIRVDCIVIAAVAALLLAAYIAGLVARVRWLTTASGVLLFTASAFGVIYFLMPKLRYRRFLADLSRGLTHEMAGSVVSVADAAQEQDGARVLPVHILLDAEQDERIVYLNASKRALFPGAGAHVRLRLCGRHILEVLDGNSF